jgi:cellulose synthase/poly-beta-1,6-N-acetylglucosamine synthase-like glycosyltransferase
MSVLDIFEREMDSLKDASSLFGANLFLVEDRLLSLLAVMLSGDLKFVPHARFYYQSETTLTSLFSQRRRWNNGGAAAHIEAVRLIYRFRDYRSLTFKLVAGAQSVAQFGSDFALGCITPALQFHTVMACIESLATDEVMSLSSAVLKHEAIIEMSVAAVLFAFMLVHYFSGSGASGLLATVTTACLAASIGCVLFMFMALVACLGSFCPTPHSSGRILMTIAIMSSLNYLSFLAHSLIHRDLESIALVATHLPACLFWQAYGWFTTLHASLLHAISWGNRPDDTKARNGMRWKSGVLATVVFVLNFLAIVLRNHTAELMTCVYVILAGPNVLMQLMALPLRVLAPKDSS